MGGKTKIQWTERTWNPIRGCRKVSEGCRNCYAMRQAHRFSGPGEPYHGLTKLTEQGPEWTGAVRLVPEALKEPLSWEKPQRIFVNSMSDLFHEDVPFEFTQEVFFTMNAAFHHTFQVLTKRPERMRTFICDFLPMLARYPLRNVWLGVSVENQATVDKRLPILLKTPAAVRFLSIEPLLEIVTLWPWIGRVSDALGLHWAIVGGESGPGARECSLMAIDTVVGQCRERRIPIFVKQLGRRPIEDRDWKRTPLQLKDSKGGDPAEWPESLRVRQYPQ